MAYSTLEVAQRTEKKSVRVMWDIIWALSACVWVGFLAFELLFRINFKTNILANTFRFFFVLFGIMEENLGTNKVSFLKSCGHASGKHLIDSISAIPAHDNWIWSSNTSIKIPPKCTSLLNQPFPRVVRDRSWKQMFNPVTCYSVHVNIWNTHKSYV